MSTPIAGRELPEVTKLTNMFTQHLVSKSQAVGRLCTRAARRLAAEWRRRGRVKRSASKVQCMDLECPEL